MTVELLRHADDVQDTVFGIRREEQLFGIVLSDLTLRSARHPDAVITWAYREVLKAFDVDRRGQILIDGR